MSFIRNISIISLCLLALVGCGGGASDSSGALTLAVTAPADTSQPGTATARYTAADGRNPMGLEISFSTDRPDLVALDASNRSVGSDGSAAVTFRVTAVQTTTTVRIIAASGDLSTFQTLTLQGDAEAPPPTPPSATITPAQVQVLSITPMDGKLALKGTGTPARPENGFVSFKVIDNSSTPAPNQVVDFTVTPSNNGGVVLTPASATTNSTGVVTVGVSSGATQASLQITATLRSNPTLTATAQLSVTSGPPDQDSFSLAAVTLNSESYNHDGVSVPITVRLGDHFNNPPPAGTVVLFTTNAGVIGGSGVTDANGTVTVNWVSGEPRTDDGRFVIMAYATGEESFTDYNGNGLADAGEFTDTGSAFRDDDADGVRDALEPYTPFTSGDPYSTGDTLYNGMYQGAAFTAAPRSKHIFRNIELVMSTDAANITTSPASLAAPGSLEITVSDLNGNPMAAGTTVTVTVPFGTTTGSTSYTFPNTTIPVTSPSYPAVLTINVAAGTTPVAKSGLIKIAVRSPGGLVTEEYVSISGMF